MRQDRFPSGWDEEKVRLVLAHYEEQSDEDAVAEDEAGVAAESSEPIAKRSE